MKRRVRPSGLLLLCLSCSESPKNPFVTVVHVLLTETNSDNTPAGIMNPLFTNETCSYFTAPETICSQGNWAVYAIAAEETADVAAGVKFAVENNIRLTIKNTGHE